MSDEYYDDVWGKPTVPDQKIVFKWDSISSDDYYECRPIVPLPPVRIRTVKPKAVVSPYETPYRLQTMSKARHEPYMKPKIRCPICDMEKGFQPFGNQVKIEEVGKGEA